MKYSTKKQLEKFAFNYNAAKDFDYVISEYDRKEISSHLVGKDFLILGESAGTNTELLYKYANSIDIVEGSSLAINRTKKRINKLFPKATNIGYFNSFWEEYNPKKLYSDVIIIRGLEHDAHPVILLKKLKKIITKNGAIHIIVPNAYSFHRLLMILRGEIKNFHYLRPRDYEIGHVQYFDKKTLTHDVREAGFEIKLIHSFFVKPFKNEIMSKFTMNRNNLFVKMCYLSGKLFPNIGTQIYCVAINK